MTDKEFKALTKNKHIFTSLDTNREVDTYREYEFREGLYEYRNKYGVHIIRYNYFICKEYGQIFYLDNDEIKYFLDKKLVVPKRCILCRKGIQHQDWVEHFKCSSTY